MGTSYEAYLFIGIRITHTDHFFALGKKVTYECNSHGVQKKKFCGDCGREAEEQRERLWTPDMLRAAELKETTPEKLWAEIFPGSFYSAHFGKIGFWRFGYERNHYLFGTAVASQEDYDAVGSGNVSIENLTQKINEIQQEFSILGIKAPVQVIAVLDCG